MGKSKIETRTLQRAAEVVGGRLRLARRLQVPIMVLDRWLAGEQTPPQVYFLEAVDVVLNQEPARPSAGGDEIIPQREIEKKTGDTLA